MISDWIEHAATVTEALGAVILVGGIAVIGGRACINVAKSTAPNPSYDAVRSDLARVLLLGLEILVAADILETASLGVDLHSLAFLAGIVAVRIALSWSLEVETTGQWPWQQPYDTAASEQA